MVKFSAPDLFASSGWGEGVEGVGSFNLLKIGINYDFSQRIYCLSSYEFYSKPKG
jgi:hypothetical protein